MKKMTSILPTKSFTRILRRMRSLISLSLRFDKANQTIGALRFENNFLAKKTKKLDAKLFQVKAQLERDSSAKLDEMLNF